MTVYLSGLNNKVCMVYIDDVIVYGKTELEHDENLRKVLQRLSQNGFKLNSEKCVFRRKSIECLGHVVSQDGIKPNPAKISALVGKPYPKNVKQVKSFLGLTGYYRKFVPKYSDIAKPLTNLTKVTEWSWSDECKQAYDTLVTHITSSPILAYPDFARTFYVTTDASGHGIGAVLTQIHNNVHRPIAYYSRCLNKAEQKYPIYDLEGLAIKCALVKWKFYLIGYDVVVRTDNKPVLSLLKSNECDGRIARYLASIMDFNVTFEYLPGKQNTFADFLSRNVNVLTRGIKKNEFNINDISNIIRAQNNDEYCNKISKNIRNNVLFCMSNKLLYRVKNSAKCLVVPRGLIDSYLHYFHNNIGCHEGYRRTFSRMSKSLYWPGIFNDVKQFVYNCKICRLGKPDHRPKNILGQFPRSTVPFQRVHIDILGPLPASRSNFKYVVVAVDSFSHYSIIKPLRYKTSRAVCQVIQKEILDRFQCPEMFVTDMGTEFTSCNFKEMCNTNDIILHFCSPYHHSSNGLVERFNLQIENALRCLLIEKKGNWDQYIDSIAVSLNTTVHGAVNVTPYEVVHNKTFPVKLPGILGGDCKFEDNVLDLYSHVDNQLESSSNKMRHKYNKSKRHREFKIDDIVFVRVPDHPNKLKPLFRGPVKVICVHPSNMSYDVIDEQTGVVSRVHINNIK